MLLHFYHVEIHYLSALIKAFLCVIFRVENFSTCCLHRGRVLRKICGVAELDIGGSHARLIFAGHDTSLANLGNTTKIPSFNFECC